MQHLKNIYSFEIVQWKCTNLTINIIPKYPNLRSNNKFYRVLKIFVKIIICWILDLSYLRDNLPNKSVSKLHE